MIEQTSIFDLMHPEFQIDKPIRLIELFGGIGAQSRAPSTRRPSGRPTR